MTAPSSFRRALIVLVTAAIVASGGLLAATTAQAIPGTPGINAPLDDTQGIFSVTVEPAPNPLPHTVTVFHRNLQTGVVSGLDNGGCQVSVPANTPAGDTFNCNVVIPEGEYGFYDLFAVATDADGDSPPSSNISSVRYGPAASAATVSAGSPLDSLDDPIGLASEGDAQIAGNGPALGTIEVFGYRAGDDPGNAVTLGLTGVSIDGSFSAPITFPAAPTFGLWELYLVATDIQGGSFQLPDGGGTYTVSVVPTQPLVTVVENPGTIDVVVDGLAAATVGARVLLDAYGAQTAGPTCPVAWNGDLGTPSPVGPSVTCNGVSLPAGIHVVETVQFADGVTGVVRQDAVYVPGTPSLTVEAFPGGATFGGAITAPAPLLTAASAQVESVTIEVRDGASQVACSTEVDLVTGQWSCSTPIEPGADTFTATAVANTFTSIPNSPGAADVYRDGVSAASAGVPAVIVAGSAPLPPSMSYELGPASIDVRASGVANGAIGLSIYRPTPGGEGGYNYGDPVAECGANLVDANDGAPLTSPSVIDDCRFTGLAPGIWNVYGNQALYYESSEFIDHYIFIPQRPTFTASGSGIGQITASGQGDPGFRVLVRQLGGDAACSTTVGTGGAWTCVITGVSGDVILRAQQQSQGFVAQPGGFFGLLASYDGFSAFTAPVAVAVPAAPTPTAIAWTLEGYDGGPLQPGQTLELSAQGLPPQTDVVIEIRSTPQVLGSAAADDLGAFALTVTVPEDLEPGEHTLVGIATPPGGVPSEIAIPVTVVAAEVVDDGTGAPAPEPVTAPESEGGATGAADRADPAAPSAISDSIPTIDRIFRTPLLAVTAGGLALAILLLVAFPAELLNNTIAENSRRIGRWYAALDDRLERFTEWFARVTRSRAIAAALLVTMTAVIFGFVDPQYGFDPVSLRMTASLALGLFVVTYVAAWISGAIIRRVWSIPTRVGLQPAALLFAVVGVVIARLLDFSPGFLIGLVIGLDVLARVGAPYRVRALLTNLGVTVGLALLGWIGFSALTAFATGEPGWAQMLISDALVATAAEGLTAALASMLPLGFLAGHEIAKQSRVLWLVSFGVVATLFALIVLPTAEGEAEVADVSFWLLVMVIFAAVVLTLWALLHFTRGADDEDAEPADPSASTVSATR